MTHPDVMTQLPELPSDIDEGRAGLWAATVLMTAALERQWDRERLRLVMFTLCAGLLGDATEEQLHAELQAALGVSRARGADKQ